ncbi:survival motor neuron protein-like [Sander lucioperca]|uniref:survival motor neuron protein-like n=1 Tax=Sander lucioperca TaxID=283035 RepID=UPI001653C403|nr:survival motor neuron protein-like [Sander lucioperca]
MEEETENTVDNGPAEPKHFGHLTGFRISRICILREDTELEQKDGQQDEQKDGQQDGQTVPPPAAEPGTESKWAVGAQCRAVWSEDGRLYPATVLCLDGERCRVRFNGYGNQQDVDLSDLKSPDAAPQTQRPNSQDWKPGARCRAVYVEDGLVYPAVVLWVKGQRCGVRFDDYNNEEEVDAGSLMNPDELHGPSRATKVKEKASNRRKVEKEEEKKRGNQQRDGAEKPTNHNFSFFPPFPPPPSPRSASGDAVSFIPPPPPLWAFGGKESSSAAVDASSSMLMLWYMCGFHTGSYMAQQGFQSSSKD